MDAAAQKPPEDVDQVRAYLRDRGYLHSPLERYVIEGGGRGSFLLWDVRVAAKVGVLAGVLFSIMLGLQALAANPELAARPGDLLVWMGYLFTVTGAATALLDALLGALLRGLAALLHGALRPEILARIASSLVGAALLAFLAAFWLGEPVPRVSSALRSVASAVLLATLAAFMARLASVSVLAFAVRLGAFPEKQRRRGIPSMLLWPLLLTAALISAWVASGAPGAEQPSRRTSSPFATQPPDHPVDLVGIDGLSFEESMTMPVMAEMARRGYVQPLAPVGTEGWQSPAAIWTSVSTGLPPERHGMTSLGVARVPGISTALRDRGGPLALVGTVLRLLHIAKPQAVQHTARTAKALWEILSEKNRTVAAINFWGTTPAQDLPGGTVVSEAALFALMNDLALRMPASQAIVSPQAVEPLLQEQLIRAGDDGPHQNPDLCDTPKNMAFCVASVTDRFHAYAMSALRSSPNAPMPVPQHVLLYLPGRDIVSYFVRTGFEPASALATCTTELASVISRELAPLATKGTLMIVCSPGRAAPATMHGMLLVAGHSVRPGSQEAIASLLDVAPTYLYFAGFPTSDDMPGRVLADAADDAFRSTYPVRSVATFGDRDVTAQAAASSINIYENLKALGYVQ